MQCFNSVVIGKHIVIIEQNLVTCLNIGICKGSRKVPIVQHGEIGNLPNNYKGAAGIAEYAGNVFEFSYEFCNSFNVVASPFSGVEATV